VTLDTVKEFGGAGGPGTNPEQLFAAGYCGVLPLGAQIRGRARPVVKVPADSAVTAHVGIGQNPKGAKALPST
jgi:osmotically inducible protein OsmC